MLLERSEIEVKAGVEDEFLGVMTTQGLPMLTGFPGVVHAQIGRGVENPGKFIFLVQWNAIEDHAAFNASELHPKFLQLFGPYALGGIMEHFQMV